MSRGKWSVASMLRNGREIKQTQKWAERPSRPIPLPHAMPGITKEMLTGRRASTSRIRDAETH